MENSDMPASPQFGTEYNRSGDFGGRGLTKREHFAGLAMQGWLARCANVPHSVELRPEKMAEVALSMADALLAELEK